jgi:hypothetical protein
MRSGAGQVGVRLVNLGWLRRFDPLVSALLATLGHRLGAVTLVAFGGPAAAPFAAAWGRQRRAHQGKGDAAACNLRGGSTAFGRAFWRALAPAMAPLLFRLVIEAFGATPALALSTGLSLVAFAAFLALRPAAARTHPA